MENFTHIKCTPTLLIITEIKLIIKANAFFVIRSGTDAYPAIETFALRRFI